MSEELSKVAKLDHANVANEVINNMIDYLIDAVDQLEDRPKYSIISFYSAVELFLKAQLMSDHWSLIVTKDANIEKFKDGDFSSVTFIEAIKRLKDVLNTPVGQEGVNRFDTVRKRRNKLVHFFHGLESEEVKQEVAFETLLAWESMYHLMISGWKQTFIYYQPELEKISARFAAKRYLVNFKNIVHLSSAAYIFAKCDTSKNCIFCNTRALRANSVLGELEETTCDHCQHEAKRLRLPCSGCHGVCFIKGWHSYCDLCHDSWPEGALVEILQNSGVQMVANCTTCAGGDTVFKFYGSYLCASCLNLTDLITACDGCHRKWNSELTDSYHVGCPACEGSPRPLGR